MEDKRVRRIAVIGLGYVGLPLCELFVENGHTVFGIEPDRNKLNLLTKKESYLSDLSNSDVDRMFATQRFHTGDSYDVIAQTDAVIICVQTPLDQFSVPDSSFVRSALNSSLPHLRPGQLIVLESTTYPGMTEEELKPMIESAGFRVGQDIYLAHSPERVDPGQQEIPLHEIPKVIGGVTAACLSRAKELYSSVFAKIVPVSSPRTAEMTKLLENCYRFINISFMNEVAMLCEKAGINVWECIHAADSKPFGFTAFYPGPGIGGHCIPVDPLFLQWKAEQFHSSLQFIELARQINDRMPAYIVKRVASCLNKPLKESRLLIIGVTYKKDVNDLRESPALKIIEKLLQQGATVHYYDPYIEKVEIGGTTLPCVPISQDALPSYDCTVILTDHSGLPYKTIVEHSKLVIDTRNVTGHLNSGDHVVLL